MKALKKICAAILALMMLTAMTGCHKKNEVAVTIGDYEFTSAYYMTALMAADSEARTKVDEAKAEKEDDKEIDYYAEKIDGKKYVEWVEDEAIENLKKIAAYKSLCKENKLELDEETEANVKSYAEYYWSSYGYGTYYEPNGVSLDTYTKYMRDNYYFALYFDHLYGEGGEKEIASEEVRSTINNKFVIANVLSASLSEMTEEDIESTVDQFNAYATELKEGKRSFLEIYNEYNNIQETKTENATQQTDVPKPKDENASIIGDEDTSYESKYFKDIKAMAVGEIKVIENEEENGLMLVVKQDLSADEYYYDTLDSDARHLIADEEYEKTVTDYGKKLDCEINKYAISQFKVKKIKRPEAAA